MAGKGGVKKEKKKVKREIAKVLNKGHTNEYLMSINPYAQSILDPFNFHGARIPDLVTTPSATFSIVDRRTLTTHAAGGTNITGICYGLWAQNAAAFAGSLVPINQNNAAYDYIVGCTFTGSGCAPNDLFPAVNGPAKIYFPQWNSGGAGIPTLFTHVRLVSAGFAINYTGTQVDSKGKMTLAFAPRNTIGPESGGGNLISIDRIARIPGARVIPVNQLTGGTVLYRPQDNVSLQYTNIYPKYGDALNGTRPEMLGGELYAICDGLTADVTFQVTAVFNYEGLPTSNQLNLIQTAHSVSDPIALSHAMNTASQAPSSKATTKEVEGLITGKTQLNVPQNLSSSSLSHTEPKQEQKSMVESIMDTVEKVAQKALPIAKEVLPLLAGL